MIGILTIIPILGSVITIFLSNYGILTVILKFYKSGAGENENDVVAMSWLENVISAFNLRARVSVVLEVLSRLDHTGSKEMTRVILFPLFYLMVSLLIVAIGIVRRAGDHKSPTTLVIAVCGAILVGVGNLLIFVVSDSDLVELWGRYLRSFFCREETEEDQDQGPNSGDLGAGAGRDKAGTSVENPMGVMMVDQSQGPHRSTGQGQERNPAGSAGNV